MAHHSARKTNGSLAHIRLEKKMNRLALQNPPRQTEKRQCPAFLPEEQWPDEMQNVLFIRRYAKRLFLRFHENGGTMRLSLRSPYCH
jgi:hypothetical protein